MKFRFLLPVIFLGVSVLLTQLGERRLQRNRSLAIKNFGGIYELGPDTAATERYVDFAINGPAFTAALYMPIVYLPNDSSLINRVRVTFYGRIMRYQWHWWYYGYLIAMWYLIGSTVDKLREVKRLSFGVSSRLATLGCCLLGLFTYWGIREWGRHDWMPWFQNSVYAWSILLSAVGLLWAITLLLKWRRSQPTVVP